MIFLQVFHLKWFILYWRNGISPSQNGERGLILEEILSKFLYPKFRRIMFLGKTKVGKKNKNGKILKNIKN
jgi:hypothetical protein